MRMWETGAAATFGCGTVFEVVPSISADAETILHVFSRGWGRTGEADTPVVAAAASRRASSARNDRGAGRSESQAPEQRGRPWDAVPSSSNSCAIPGARLPVFRSRIYPYVRTDD